MKLSAKILHIFMSSVLLAANLAPLAAQAGQRVSAPVLIDPNEETITGYVKPLIRGIARSGYAVHVYVDGVYNGKTKRLEHGSGTADFFYRPFLNLSVGRHEVWAVAEDEDGDKSPLSNILSFNIEKPFPAPTLFAPVVNKNTAMNRPFVVGLAKNDSLVRVFIDHKLFGEFKVKNHESGVANFAYQPFVALTAGHHLVYTTAIDGRGKESSWSNVVYFSVGGRNPQISKVAAEERTADGGGTRVLGEEFAAEKADDNSRAGSAGSAGNEMKYVEDLLRSRESSSTKATGLVDESKENQGKLRLNLVIFILFLLAVIGWIFWVNRELIREQRAENKDGSPDDKKGL